LNLSKLKNKYNKICNKYVEIFCKKNKLYFKGWIGDNIGGVSGINDYFFDFDDIKYAVDNEIKFSWVSDWYYFEMDFHKTAHYNIDDYCILRRDAEYKFGFGFDNHKFEKELLNKLISK